jgi:uncharacterized protein (DUF983 family)
VTEPTALATPTTRILRALTLRCPDCGGRGLFRRWMQLQPVCPTCRLKTDRGNRDHFVGAYLVNLIIAELLFAIGFGVWMLSVWPNVPWGRIEFVLVGAMLVAPLVLYPFTRTVWLAADLIFDPPRDSDFARD